MGQLEYELKSTSEASLPPKRRVPNVLSRCVDLGSALTRTAAAGLQENNTTQLQRRSVLVSCACLAREAWPGSRSRAPWTLGPQVCETRSARSPRDPALRGMPRSVLGAIVGGGVGRATS